MPFQQSALNEIVNAIPGCVYQFALHKDGRISFPYCSRAFEDLLGISVNDLKTDASHLMNMIHPNDLAPFQKSIESSAADLSPWKHDFRIISSNGQMIWLRGHSNPQLQSDGSVVWNGMLSDITERRLLEEEFGENRKKLLESNQIMTGILEHTHMMAVYLDARFNFIWVNRAYAQSCRRDPASFIGKNHFELYPHEENQAMFQRVVDTGEPFFIAAKPFTFPDQPERGVTYWDWSLTPVKGDDRRVVGLVFTLSDVTEQIRSREALRDHYTLLRTVIDTIATPVFYKDVEGIFLGCNSAYESLVGLPKEKIIGKTIFDVMPHDLAKEYHETDQQILKSQNLQVYKTAGSDLWGNHRHVVIHKQPFYDDLGAIKGLVGVIVDITEHRQIEDALREAKSHAENLIQTANAIVVELDADGNIVVFNEAAEKLTGYSREELADKNWFEVVVPRERYPEVWEIFEKLSIGGIPRNFENPILTKSGEERHIVWQNSDVIRNGQVVGTISFGIDITQRRQAEKAMQESEERFRLLFEQAPLGYQSLDENGDFIMVNETWCKLLGYSKEEVLGRNFSEFIHPDFREHFLENFPKFKKIGYILGIEFEMIRKDGSEIIVSFDGKIAHMEDGQFRQTHCVLSDISERKRIEEALRESEKRVTRKLNAIMQPDGDIGLLDLTDILDVDAIQSLMNNFYSLTNIGVGIVDLSGNVLIGTGWQDICTKFHRVHPDTLKNCRESDLELSRDIAPGTFKAYRCKNNLWDIATPIMVAGKHLGNLFLGQFLYDEEQPDRELFCRQARRYGFDEQIYLTALDKLPRWTKDTVETVMAFYTSLTGMISSLGYANIKLARALAEQQHTDEALRTSKDQMRVLLETIPDLVWLKDPDGVYKFCNPRFESFFGAKEADIVGKTDFDFQDAQMAEFFRRHDQLAIAAGKPSMNEEEITFAEDGHKEILETIKSPIYRPDGQLFGVLGVGRDITARKRAEDALRESEEKFRAYVANAPDAIFVVDASGQYVEVNEAACRLTGYKQSEILNMKLTELSAMKFADGQMGRLQELKDFGRLSFETTLKRKDGATVTVSLDGVKLNGNRFMAFCSDITETKRLKELESRAERLETAGMIAGQVAHDFNNLLGPLIAYPEFIREELPDDHPVLPLLEQMENSAKKIAVINQDLLTMGRRGHYNLEPLNLNVIIRQAVDELRPHMPTITCELDLGDDLMDILGGEAQLHRVFSNLLHNAMDAMQESGTITIKTENYYIDDSSILYSRIPKGEYVKLTISDTGCGIPDTIAERIFDPFFTSKTSDKKRGSGLGLSVVDAVIRDHNGYIDLSTKVGEGTSFYLYFPISRTAPVYRPVDDISGGDERILIVDDDDVQLNVSAQLLIKLGYDVSTANSGEAAIALIQKRPYDLLILDMIMPPGIDGAETYRRILQLYPAQRAIIASGFAETERVLEMKKMGAGIFIKKPLTRKALAVAVRYELDKVPEISS